MKEDIPEKTEYSKGNHKSSTFSRSVFRKTIPSLFSDLQIFD